MRLVGSIALILLGLHACKHTQGNEPKQQLLCQVYDNQLFFSDVVELIPASQNAEDSLNFLRAYVDRWVKDQLILNEAESAIPDKGKIDDMVKTYRESLLMVNYKQKLYENIDVDISSDEIQSYYNEHLDDFLLQNTIARLVLFAPATMSPEHQELWESALSSSNLDLLTTTDSAGYAFVDTSLWLTASEIEDLLPQGPPQTDWLKEGEIRDESVFIFVYDLRPKGTPSPLSVVKDEIMRSIVNNRRKKIVAEKRNELYQNELNKRNVQNYVQ